MNLHAVLYFLSAVFQVCLGFFIIFKNLRSKINLPLFLLVLSAFVWQLGSGIILLSKDPSFALIITKIAFLGVILAPITTYHFTLNVLFVKKTKILFFGYLLAILFIPLTWTSLMLDGVNSYTWGFFFKAGLLHPVFLVFFMYFIMKVFIHLFLSYKKERSSLEKNRKRYFFAALFMAYLGVIDYLPTYGVDVLPFSHLAIITCVLIFSYAIVRHRLMDIEVIIRETVVFAGIFGFSVGTFVLAMIAGQQYLQPYIGRREWIIPAFALLMVTFAVRPIEKLVYNTIGKLLFKKRQEYQKTLQDAATGMATVRNPKKLIELITHIISMKMKLDNVSILIYDDKLKQYRLKASRGKNRPSHIYSSINRKDSLVEWLTEKKEPIALDELQRWIKEEESATRSSILTSELIHMEEKIKNLKGSLCVPSFYRDELLGILVLGDKKSGDFFRQDDIDLFKALADEAAIALKNSQLYFEIDERAREIEALYEREHNLFLHSSIAFAAAIDARDPYTHGHSERVTNYSMTMLDYIPHNDEVEQDPAFRQKLRIAAVLHDIGKLGITDAILHKPEMLSGKERKEVEKHPAVGADIVYRIKGLRNIVGAIRHHHERYDGKGYPDKLKSEQIPFMARLIAVADTYDAMTSNRPYRKALPDEVAKDEIRNNGATQFDPHIVAAFLKAFEDGKIGHKPKKEEDTLKKKIVIEKRKR